MIVISLEMSDEPLKSNMKGALMSLSDKLLLRKRAIIETVNDELKNTAQVEHYLTSLREQ